jgi:hypothetical protein
VQRFNVFDYREGARRRLFRDEMSRTMMPLGAGSLAEFGPHYVELT